MQLNVVESSSVEPVTIEEAKLFVRLSIPEEDSVILGLIRTARNWCEKYTGRSFINKKFELVLDDFGQWGYGAKIRLPRSPVVSVQSITYRDSSNQTLTLPPNHYEVRESKESAGYIATAYNNTFPVPLPIWGAVTITFVAGYGEDAESVPEDAKLAIKQLVNYWYLNREFASETEKKEIPMGVKSILSSLCMGEYS